MKLPLVTGFWVMYPQKALSPMRHTYLRIWRSITACIFESFRSDSSLRLNACLQIHRSGELNRFEVTKITKRKEQEVTLLLSEKGITNTNSSGIERSLERWS